MVERATNDPRTTKLVQNYKKFQKLANFRSIFLNFVISEKSSTFALGIGNGAPIHAENTAYFAPYYLLFNYLLLWQNKLF